MTLYVSNWLICCCVIVRVMYTYSSAVYILWLSFISVVVCHNYHRDNPSRSGIRNLPLRPKRCDSESTGKLFMQRDPFISVLFTILYHYHLGDSGAFLITNVVFTIFSHKDWYGWESVQWDHESLWQQYCSQWCCRLLPINGMCVCV